MKTIERFMSVIALVMIMASLSAQQGPPPGAPPQGQGQFQRMTPEETAKTQTDWMKTDLKLDEATQKKVYDVNLKYAKLLVQERDKMMAGGDREAMRAKMTEINGEKDKELKVILGDKNFELFKTKEAERREAMRNQNPPPPPKQN
jgi:hypothetical protein